MAGGAEDKYQAADGVCKSVLYSMAMLFKSRTAGQLAPFEPESTPTTNPIVGNPIADNPGPTIRPAGLLRTVPNEGMAPDSWFSADGRVFASGGGRALRLFDVDSGDLITTVEFDTMLRATAAARWTSASTGQCLFAVGGEDGSVAVLTLEQDGSGDDRVSREPWLEPKAFGDDGAVNAVAFSEDTALLAASWRKGPLRVFESVSGRIQKTLDLGPGIIRGCLYFSRNYLVGSSGVISNVKPIRASTIKFWCLAKDFEESRVIEYSSSVQAFAIEPDERGFAVGTADGAVRLYSSTEDKNPWLLIPTDSSLRSVERKGAVSSLAFGRVLSEDSASATLLGVGWRTGRFAVYDHATVAQVAGYEHRGTNNGYVCCFSPDGGTIATGGGNGPVVLHAVRPAVPQTVVPKQNQLITTAFVRGGTAVVATGNGLNVYTSGGGAGPEAAEPLLTITTEEILRHLVEISPDERLMAFSQRLNKSVIVYDLPAQREVKAIEFPTGCDGVRWSAKGTYLVAWGGFGAKVFDTKDFNEVATILDPNNYVGDCAISPDETLIATCGASMQVNLRRLPNPGADPLVSIQDTGFTAAVCFNPAQSDPASGTVQIAYCGANESGEYVHVCDVDVDSTKATRVYRLGEKNTLGPWDQQVSAFRAHPKAFSPDGKYLLCWNSLGSDNEGGITVFNVDGSEQGSGVTVPWSGLLASLLHEISNRSCDASAGGGAPVARFGAGWLGDSDSLRLYFACGMELITIRVHELWLAALDGMYSARQLCAVTGFRPDLIVPIIDEFPHVINIRSLRGAAATANTADTTMEAVEGALGEAATVAVGDTVLHFCGRNQQFHDLISTWLQVDAKGDEMASATGLTYTLIANEDRTECNACGLGRAEREGVGRFGATALHCAIANSAVSSVQLLIKRLASRLGPPHAVLLNDMLALMAIALPEHVPHMLRTLDDNQLLQPQELLCEHLGDVGGEQLGNTVRLSISREEVRGSAAYMATKHLPHDVLRERQHVWHNFINTDTTASPVPVAAHVVALAGFLSSPVMENGGTRLSLAADSTNNRTYGLIVELCTAEVYRCRIMHLATQFKWEKSVHPMQVKMMCTYLLCTFIDTAAMLSCTHEYNDILPRISASSISGVATSNAPDDYDGGVQGGLGRFPWYNLLLVVLSWCCELGVFINEMSQAKLEGIRRYSSSPWNICDLLSSTTLLAATTCHVLANTAPDGWDHDWWEDVVANLGSTGVLFKWLGTMDYMRLWSTTASHVRMISEIAEGAMPFVAVIMISIVGFSFCFMILLPSSPEFDYTDADGGGVLKPFITVYRLVRTVRPRPAIYCPRPRR